MLERPGKTNTSSLTDKDQTDETNLITDRNEKAQSSSPTAKDRKMLSPSAQDDKKLILDLPE